MEGALRKAPVRERARPRQRPGRAGAASGPRANARPHGTGPLPYHRALAPVGPLAMSASPQIDTTAAREILSAAAHTGRHGRPPASAGTRELAAAAATTLHLPPAELYDGLTRAIMGRHPDLALQWLRDVGVLAHVLPELDATVSFSQEGGRRHKDVWDHTKQVVRQSVPRPAVRWAAVLHDIGKVTTRRFLPGGKVTFHGHAEEGVRMFRRGPARRIGFPPEVRTRVEALIRHHLRPGQYDGSWTDAAVRRFARDMDDILIDLLDLSRADVTSKRPGKRKRCLALISELSRRIRALAEADARPRPLPPGLGKLLMDGLGLPPGKHIGELRERLAQLCAAGEISGGQDPSYYLDVVRARNLMDGIAIRPPRGFGP